MTASVLAQLNELTKDGPGDLYASVTTDVSKLVEDLLKNVADPLRDVGERFAKEIEANANALIDGLAASAAQAQRVGQSRDQVAGLEEARYRFGLELSAQRAGRPGQAYARRRWRSWSGDSMRGRLGSLVLMRLTRWRLEVAFRRLPGCWMRPWRNKRLRSQDPTGEAFKGG